MSFQFRCQFTYRHVEVSHSLNQYAETQFQELGRFLPTDSRWQVVFSMDRYQYNVEVAVQTPWGHFKAVGKASDFYLAVDLASEKISKQFKKQKDLHQYHKKPELSRTGKLEHVNEALEYQPPWSRQKESA